MDLRINFLFVSQRFILWYQKIQKYTNISILVLIILQIVLFCTDYFKTFQNYFYVILVRILYGKRKNNSNSYLDYFDIYIV